MAPVTVVTAVVAVHLLLGWALAGGRAGAPARGTQFDRAALTLVQVRLLPSVWMPAAPAPRAALTPPTPPAPRAHESAIARPARATDHAQRTAADGAAPLPAALTSLVAADVPMPSEGDDGVARWRDYLPSQRLERAVVPRSSPDESMLAGVAFSGLPLRLRLFIDRAGSVVDVVVLQSSEDDEALDRLRRMFLDTLFIAGRHQGADVASYQDVELSIGEPK